MNKYLVLIVLSLSVVNCQVNGGFWWKNKKETASESRSAKDTGARVRTLPPRFRKETTTTTTTTTTTESSLFEDYVDEFEEEDKKMFKFDSTPDCACVKKFQCNVDNTIIVDGSGIIMPRSYSLCAKDEICCRIPKTIEETTPKTTQKPATTTAPWSFRPLNLLTTFLKPVASTSFQKCVSHKGNKIEKRILIDNDYDEEDEDLGESSFAEFPWMLEVQKKNRKSNVFEYKCGAVLINPTTALTAAHCLKGTLKSPEQFKIRAGEWDRASELEFLPHQDRSVSQIRMHPDYYSGGLYNDVAVVKWTTPFEDAANVKPLCLPEATDTFESQICTVTGWGRTNKEGINSERLKFINLPIINRQKCEQKLQTHKLGQRFKLHESFICAGSEAGKDTCDGDGGSPLVCERKDKSFVLAGLVSWGLGCGEKVPAMYANIPNLLSWIKSNI